MRALAHCIQALKGAEATTTEQELRDIQQLIDVTQAHLQANKAALPRVQTQRQPTEQHNQAAPRVHTDTVPRVPDTEKIIQATATQPPNIAEVQPPHRTWRTSKQNDTKTSTTNSDLTRPPPTQSRAAQEAR